MGLKDLPLMASNKVTKGFVMQPKTREVLMMKANGLMSKQIASKLNIHRRTVEWHLKSACQELKALNSVHAVAIAMRDGLILAGEIGCIVLLCWNAAGNNIEVRRNHNPPQCRIARRENVA